MVGSQKNEIASMADENLSWTGAHELEIMSSFMLRGESEPESFVHSSPQEPKD